MTEAKGAKANAHDFVLSSTRICSEIGVVKGTPDLAMKAKVDVNSYTHGTGAVGKKAVCTVPRGCFRPCCF
ncbi:hypothetical protein U1Q18_032721 [Sarracenia purpurea var. burkii]